MDCGDLLYGYSSSEPYPRANRDARPRLEPRPKLTAAMRNRKRNVEITVNVDVDGSPKKQKFRYRSTINVKEEAASGTSCSPKAAWHEEQLRALSHAPLYQRSHPYGGALAELAPEARPGRTARSPSYQPSFAH